jgi:hypothetical protein
VWWVTTTQRSHQKLARSLLQNQMMRCGIAAIQRGPMRPSPVEFESEGASWPEQALSQSRVPFPSPGFGSAQESSSEPTRTYPWLIQFILIDLMTVPERPQTRCLKLRFMYQINRPSTGMRNSVIRQRA